MAISVVVDQQNAFVAQHDRVSRICPLLMSSCLLYSNCEACMLRHICVCSARQLLAATEADVTRRHVNASSASYAADLRTTLDAFESRDSYQSVGRVLSHSLGQEHSCQQTSYLGSGRAPMYQSITGQTMYQTVTETDHDTVSSDSQNDSGSKGDHDDNNWQYLQARPEGEARSAAPSNTEVASYSNSHSTTSTLNYEQVSSGAKRKHGHLDSGTQNSVTQASEGTGYSTHAKMPRRNK